MNHFIITYKMEDGTEMRESYWCQQDDPKKVKKEWTRKRAKSALKVEAVSNRQRLEREIGE